MDLGTTTGIERTGGGFLVTLVYRSHPGWVSGTAIEIKPGFHPKKGRKERLDVHDSVRNGPCSNRTRSSWSLT